MDFRDLNYRVLCPDCKNPHPKLIEDFASGDLICRDCGVVVGDRIIDTRSEWRTFSNESNRDDPSRVGAPVDPLLGTDQLDTMISGKDGFTGVSKELNRLQTRSSMRPSDRVLVNAFKDIAVMCDRINLPKTVVDRAKQLFQVVEKEKLLRGKTNQGMIAACILMACREENCARSFKEICALTRVPKKEIGRCFKLVRPYLENKPRTVNTEDFIVRPCNVLGLGMDMQRIVAEITRRATQNGCVAGKSPLTVAAAGIYMVSLLFPVHRGIQRDLAKVSGVSDVTYRNAYKEMYAHRFELVPSEMVPREIVEKLSFEYALQHRGKFPDPGPWKLAPSKLLAPKTHVGIDVVPRQYVQKLKKRPYVFNLMVVGETGLGKTTFINTLFNSILEEASFVNVQETKTVNISEHAYELTEGNVSMVLSVIDTPGFGDKIDRTEDLEPILNHIDDQNKQYLESERFRNFRSVYKDTRVHLVLYFIAPHGYLKEMDILALQELSHRANVIPVIAKSDCLTIEEKLKIKQKILTQLEKNKIEIYPFSFCEDRANVTHLEAFIPFAIVGSNQLVDVGGKRIRGRMRRWGVVDVENEQHCDFVHLRELIMSRNLHDLITSTHDVHYFNYRAQYLRSAGQPQSILACDEDFSSKIDDKSKFLEEVNRREEEIRQKFIQQVKEKEEYMRLEEEKLLRKRDELIIPLQQQVKLLLEEKNKVDALLENFQNASTAKDGKEKKKK